MQTTALTDRQRETLGKYRGFAQAHGRPPSWTELGRLLDPPVRGQTAERLVTRLRLSGYIAHGPAERVAQELLGEADIILGSVHLTNGDRARVNALRARIAELLGKPFAEAI
jgi:hypothetical protein